MSFKFNTKIYFVIYYNDVIIKFPESGCYSIPHWNGNDYPGPLLAKENKFEDFNEAVKNARICLGDFDGCIPKNWNGDKLIVSTTCNLYIEIRKIEEKIPTYARIPGIQKRHGWQQAGLLFCFNKISDAIAYSVFEKMSLPHIHPNKYINRSDFEYFSPSPKVEILNVFEIDDIVLIQFLFDDTNSYVVSGHLNRLMWTSDFEVLS